MVRSLDKVEVKQVEGDYYVIDVQLSCEGLKELEKLLHCLCVMCGSQFTNNVGVMKALKDM